MGIILKLHNQPLIELVTGTIMVPVTNSMSGDHIYYEITAYSANAIFLKTILG